MTGGRLVAIVGPSGAGKDTLMAALCAHSPDLRMVRRVITRPAAKGGEAFDGVDEATFARMAAQGAFALNWTAHGLRYGIPATIDTDLAAGHMVIFNGSRGVLENARGLYPGMETVLVTANRQVLAARLAARGRETAQDITARLDRADFVMPPGVPYRVVENNGDIDTAAQSLLNAVQQGVDE